MENQNEAGPCNNSNTTKYEVHARVRFGKRAWWPRVFFLLQYYFHRLGKQEASARYLPYVFGPVDKPLAMRYM